MKGPGHVVGTSMVFTSTEPTKFSGNFDHVCEGNFELFLDNATALLGNNSANDYVSDGYQTSPYKTLSLLPPSRPEPL